MQLQLLVSKSSFDPWSSHDAERESEQDYLVFVRELYDNMIRPALWMPIMYHVYILYIQCIMCNIVTDL